MKLSYAKRANLRRLVFQCASIGIPRSRKPNLVITQERSGSTLLMDMLAQHPDVYADPHVFLDVTKLPKFVSSPNSVASRKFREGYKAKIFSQEHNDDSLEKVFNELSCSKLGFVWLYRRDKFRQAISSAMSYETGILHKKSNSEANRGHIDTVNINAEFFQAKLDYYLRSFVAERKYLESLDGLLVLEYERSLLTPQAVQSTTQLLYQHFNVNPNFAPSVRFERTSDDSLEYVQNLSELRDVYNCKIEELGLNEFVQN